MNADNIMQADLNDIIFENRNKEYGAYDLRQHYSERLTKALTMVFFLVILFSIITFFKKNNVLTVDSISINDPAPRKIPTVKEIEKIPPPKKQTARKPTTPMLSSNFVFADSVEKVKNIKLPENFIDFSDINNVTDMPEPGAFIAAGEDQKNSEIPVALSGKNIIRNTDKPVSNADIMPQFPGGIKALIKYLERNIQDPEETRELKTVSVTVKFVVGYDGVLKSFEIIEDGGKRYNDEVLRVLKKMPLWIPGKTNGEKISVYYTIPVKFVTAE